MNDNPKVSVIIPAYNCSNFISETIESVANQSFQEFECIIVDDLSTDNTREVINDLIKIHGPKFKLIELKINSGGPAIPRNHGIKIAKGRYLAFLDADDIWHRDKLIQQVSYLENYEEIDLIATETTLIDKKSKIISKSKKKLIASQYLFKRRILFQNFFTLSSVMIRNKVFLFNTNPLFSAIEDWLLWIEITYKKDNFHILENRLTYYRILDDSLIQRNTLKPYKRVFLVINFLYFQERISLLSMVIASIVNLTKLVRQSLLINILKRR